MNGCTDTSACVDFVSSDVTNIELAHSIIIAPNPFTSYTTISLNKAQVIRTVKIIDMLGHIIYNKTDFAGLTREIVIEKGGMKAGLYTVQLEFHDQNILIELIIVQ